MWLLPILHRLNCAIDANWLVLKGLFLTCERLKGSTGANSYIHLFDLKNDALSVWTCPPVCFSAYTFSLSVLSGMRERTLTAA